MWCLALMKSFDCFECVCYIMCTVSLFFFFIVGSILCILHHKQCASILYQWWYSGFDFKLADEVKVKLSYQCSSWHVCGKYYHQELIFHPRPCLHFTGRKFRGSNPSSFYLLEKTKTYPYLPYWSSWMLTETVGLLTW